MIDQGEHQQLDFKFEISDARKIARTLVAFSNTDGGKLLIGVKDNGRIAGVRSEEEYYMLEAASSLYCKPEIDFTTQKWHVEGKTILEVGIEPGGKKPYLCKTENGKWLAYVRVDDRNQLANAIQLRVWKNKERKKGVYLKYTKTEELLLKYLDQNKRITLSGFCKVAGISRRRASDILYKLVIMDVILIEYTEKQIFYALKEKEEG